MSTFEAPKSVAANEQIQADLCGVNCNWGFGVGVVIAMIGPLPGPT